MPDSMESINQNKELWEVLRAVDSLQATAAKHNIKTIICTLPSFSAPYEVKEGKNQDCIPKT